MPRTYAPPPNATKWFPGNSLYCAAHAESRGCHKITIIIVHNSQQLQTRDGRIVGPCYSELARLSGTQLGYLLNNEDDRKAKDWLFLVFTSSAAKQITWKSCSPYFHKLRR